MPAPEFSCAPRSPLSQWIQTRKIEKDWLALPHVPRAATETLTHWSGTTSEAEPIS